MTSVPVRLAVMIAAFALAVVLRLPSTRTGAPGIVTPAGADLPVFAGTVLAGALRPLALDTLWLRADRAYREGRPFALLADLALLAALDPGNERAWSYQAAFLLHDVAGLEDNPDERFRWVREGIRFLEAGIARNPRSVDLRLGAARALIHVAGEDPRCYPHAIRAWPEGPFARAFAHAAGAERLAPGDPRPLRAAALAAFFRMLEAAAAGDRAEAARAASARLRRLEALGAGELDPPAPRLFEAATRWDGVFRALAEPAAEPAEALRGAMRGIEAEIRATPPEGGVEISDGNAGLVAACLRLVLVEIVQGMTAGRSEGAAALLAEVRRLTGLFAASRPRHALAHDPALVADLEALAACEERYGPAGARGGTETGSRPDVDGILRRLSAHGRKEPAVAALLASRRR